VYLKKSKKIAAQTQFYTKRQVSTKCAKTWRHLCYVEYFFQEFRGGPGHHWSQPWLRHWTKLVYDM